MQDPTSFESFTSDIPNQPMTPPPSPAPQPPAVSKLTSALARAQGKILPPLKNRVVDYIDNKGNRVFYHYADLADVIDCIRAALSENELCPIHRLHYSEGRYGMTTELLHSSGEKISTWYPLPDPGKQEIRAQAFGSALTYARRYSLSALLGIASEEDDDGAGAPPVDPKPGTGGSKAKPGPKPSPIKPVQTSPASPSGALEPGPGQTPVVPSQAPPQLPTDKLNVNQRGLLFATVGKHGWTNDQLKSYILTRWSLASSNQLTVEQFQILLETIPTKEFNAAIASAARARSETGGSG